MSDKKSLYAVTVDVQNLPVVQDLCDICQRQNAIIQAQAEALAQIGAAVKEEEIEATNRALAELIGSTLGTE